MSLKIICLIVILKILIKNANCGNNDYDECSANDSDCVGINNAQECMDNSKTIIHTLKTLHNDGVNTTFVLNVNTVNESFDRVHHFDSLQQKFYSPNKKVLDKVLKILSNTDLSAKCTKSLVALIQAYNEDNLWPLEFIDASGKIHSGFTSVTFSSFGNFDQCLEIEIPPINKDGWVINGKYCLLELIVPRDSINKESRLFSIINKVNHFYGFDHLFTASKAADIVQYTNGSAFRWGICVPSDCDASEIQNVINKAINPITRGLSVQINQKCQVKNQNYSLDYYEVFSISVLSLLLILVLLSTGFEIYLQNLEKFLDTSKSGQLLLSFSLIKNIKSLFEKSYRFAALDTIKLLIILNVYAIHLYAFTQLIGVITLKDFFTAVPKQFLYSNKYFLLRSPQVLDGLFVMSGFIFSYGVLGKIEKTGGKFSYSSHIFQRWIRFILPLSGSFLFFYLLPLLGNGPVWEYGVSIFMDPCKSAPKLAYSFLQINNYIDSHEMMNGVPKVTTCNSPTWFMSALFQLQIIAPFFVILYYRKPTLAIFANMAAIAIGLFLIVLPYYFGIKPYTQYFKIESINELLKSFQWYHNGTNGYVSTFFVGILFGVGLRKNVRISRPLSTLFWLQSVAAITCVFLWNNKLWQINPTAVTNFHALLWFTIGKLLSSIGFGWIFFACCSGRGGYFDRVLCWSGFRALNKLSFSIFIMHLMVIVWRIFSVKHTISVTNSRMIHNIIIDLILTTGLAFIFYIMIDSPVNNIVEIIRSPPNRPRNKHDKSHDNCNIKFETNNNNDYADNNKSLVIRL